MFPWLRLLRIGLGLIGNSKVDLLATTCIRLRVWPNDLDYNLHVNNGRYLAFADIGRLHWVVRTGMLGLARQHKAFPVIGDATAKFRRDLKVFQTFEIHTRLMGWDSKWGVWNTASCARTASLEWLLSAGCSRLRVARLIRKCCSPDWLTARYPPNCPSGQGVLTRVQNYWANYYAMRSGRKDTECYVRSRSFSTQVGETYLRPASASARSGHPATARVYVYTPALDKSSDVTVRIGPQSSPPVVLGPNLS